MGGGGRGERDHGSVADEKHSYCVDRGLWIPEITFLPRGGRGKTEVTALGGGA